MLGAKIYIDYTKYDFDECSARLQKELKNIQGEDNDVSIVPAIKNEVAIEKTVINVAPKKFMTTNWTQEQVVEWFKSKKVNDLIIENLLPCDGQLLEQLYHTLKEVPEFFHSILRADSKASLRDIVFFTTELRYLFNDHRV